MAQKRGGKAESSVERHHERFEEGFRLRALPAPPATPVPPAEEEEEEEAAVAAVVAVVEAADLLSIEPLA
jgi:hypothetical protein